MYEKIEQDLKHHQLLIFDAVLNFDLYLSFILYACIVEFAFKTNK